MTRLLALALAALVIAGCGVIDGVFASATITDTEVCDAVQELEFQAAACPPFRDASLATDCSLLSCLRAVKSKDFCQREWDELVACLVQKEHTCDELADGALTYCEGERSSLEVCLASAGCGGGFIDDSCDNDGVCAPLEGPNCSDCGFLPTCNNDVCEPENGEDELSCPRDCGVCNDDRSCASPIEPLLADCLDCSQACDFDQVCDIDENNGCTDCAGRVCNRDGACGEGEDAFCGECTKLCSDGCEAEVCSEVNSFICAQDLGDPNCIQGPPGDRCEPACALDGSCSTPGDVCVQSLVGARACEAGRCLAAGCAPGLRCAHPVAMIEVGTAAADAGLCVLECNPIDCSFGGACACAPTSALGRCGALADEGGSNVGFACSFAGSAGAGDGCQLGADCAAGLDCVGGLCRVFCDVAHACAAGATCVPLGAAGVCVD